MKFRRRHKRKTSWVPGFNMGEGVGFATLALNAIGGASTSKHFTAPLTDANDLRDAGGEGATALRVVGRFLFYRALTIAAATPGFLRWALYVAEIPGGLALGTPPDLWTVNDLSNENILLSGITLVSEKDYLTPAVLDGGLVTHSAWVEVDSSAKRTLSDDKHLYFTVQTSPVGGSAIDGVRGCGYIRVLLGHATR